MMTVQEPQAPRSHISLVPVKPEYVVDEVIQRPIRFDLEFVFLAVDRDMNGPFGFGQRFGRMIRKNVRFDRLKGVKRVQTIRA